MNHKDPLESFIRKNREAFDDSLPSAEVWEKISKDLDSDRKRTIAWRPYLWRAAAVILVFALSWVVHDLVDRNTVSINSSGIAESQLDYSPAARELLEAEAYYSNQIQEMEESFLSLTQDQPELRKDVMTEMSELDSVYVQLKHDLRDQASNEEIIEAMIQNYRVRLMILDEMLRQLKSAGATEKKEVNYEV